MQSSLTRKHSRKPSRATPDTRELARQLAGFFRYLALAGSGDFLRAVSELDLSLSQLKALSLLADEAEDLSVKALARELDLSLPATSRAVDAITRRKLVRREEDQSDRRCKRIRITPAGRKLVESLNAIRVAGLEQLLETFSDRERRKLEAALDLILERDEISRFLPRARATR